MRYDNNTIARACIAAALAMTMAAAGCGGGDNSGAPAPLQITGSVKTTPAGAPLSGYVVTFDQSATARATTDATGAFTLNVPRSGVTGADTLSITDPTGVLVDRTTIPASTKTSLRYNAGALDVSPPAAPFAVAR